MRNLEMIDGNTKKLWQKKPQIFTSPSNFFFYIFENELCAKNIQLHLEIDTVRKLNIPVVQRISTALCAMVSDGQAFLVKRIPPWGKLLQFSWGKLLHCI